MGFDAFVKQAALGDAQQFRIQTPVSEMWLKLYEPGSLAMVKMLA